MGNQLELKAERSEDALRTPASPQLVVRDHFLPLGPVGHDFQVQRDLLAFVVHVREGRRRCVVAAETQRRPLRRLLLQNGVKLDDSARARGATQVLRLELGDGLKRLELHVPAQDVVHETHVRVRRERVIRVLWSVFCRVDDANREPV